MLIALQHLSRLKIEYYPALCRPFASIVREYGRCRAEVSDGLDVLHSTTFDRFKADGYTSQPNQLAVCSIACYEYALLKRTLRPFQTPWLAARGGRLEERVFERLLIAHEQLQRALDPSRIQRGAHDDPRRRCE